MICYVLNKLLSKKQAHCIFVILVVNAIWVTSTTEKKLIGKGYRRNLFSVSNLNCTNMGEKS